MENISRILNVLPVGIWKHMLMHQNQVHCIAIAKTNVDQLLTLMQE